MTDSKKLDILLDKVTSMENRMDSMETKMDSMESRMGSMENRMDSMETKMDSIENRVDSIEEQSREIRKDVTSMKLKLENEIEKNIKFVAEGHLDLSRALHEATKPYNAIEMLQVQVSILETKVRDLEQYHKDQIKKGT